MAPYFKICIAGPAITFYRDTNSILCTTLVSMESASVGLDFHTIYKKMNEFIKVRKWGLSFNYVINVRPMLPYFLVVHVVTRIFKTSIEQ